MTAFLLAALLAAGAPARHAVIIAAPTGHSGDAPLAYAESDAQQMATVLREVGGFAAADIKLLVQPSRDTLQAVFTNLGRDVNAASDGFLLVYYSGHGDSRGMHLGAEQVPWEDLLGWSGISRAPTRLLVVDACNSGALTRFKGGRLVAPFVPSIAATPAGQALPQGLAILTSSGATEYSVESAAYAASLFTHHFVAALAGAPDRNNDGIVSLSEAYEYTTDRLRAAQASQEQQRQHPTYRYSLHGNDDLWLTRIQASSPDGGVFQLAQPGTYLWRGVHNETVLEVVVPTGEQRRVELPAGTYRLVWRQGATTAEKQVDVAAGSLWHLDAESFAATPRASVSSKGAPERRDSLQVQGGSGTPLVASAGVPAMGGLTYAHVFDVGLSLVLDAGLQVEYAQVRSPAIPSALYGGVAVVGLRLEHPVAPWLRISYGLRVGAMGLAQHVLSGGNYQQVAPLAAVVLHLEFPLGERFFIALEAQERVTHLAIEAPSTVGPWRWQTLGTLGAGVRF